MSDGDREKERLDPAESERRLVLACAMLSAATADLRNLILEEKRFRLSVQLAEHERRLRELERAD